MGYQAEGPQWRGVFLTMAHELRNGIATQAFSSVATDIVLGMAVDQLFDHAGVRLIGDRAAEPELRIDFTFTDLDECWTMWIGNGVLNARRGASPDARLTVSGPNRP